LPRPDGVATAVYLISDAGRRIDVPAQDVVIIGREDMRSGIRPDVDLTLDGASAAGISRRHCRLLHQPEGWYVEDLMSTNYTVLNGKPLRAHAPVRLIHGDELRLGKLRLRFYET
jgi:pSer/pThr/pTyr-binding forkhead associated (FHA) protein